MSDNESTSIEQPSGEVQLAPMLAKFRSELNASRKKLLRDKAQGGKFVFDDPAQMRQFLALYLLPQMVQMVEIFGPALNDTYAFVASTADDVRRLRRKVNDILDDEDGDYEDDGPSMETVQAIVTAMHTLGGLLHKKLPDDKELMEAYNAVSQRIDVLLEEMTVSDDDDDDYDDDDDDDDRDDDDADDDDDDDADEGAEKEPEAQAAPKPRSKKPPESKKPADPVKPESEKKPSETTDA